MLNLNLKPANECAYDAVSLGEIMLRLDPGEGRIRTAREFKAWEGGGEYNVVRGLHKCFGLRTGVLTAFADNEVGKLLKDLGMFMPLKKRIDGGLPVFAVCAGLILLAEKIDDPGSHTDTRPEQWFGVLPVTVRRNAYGRQLGSFRTIGTFDGKPNIPMTFIRAPAITEVTPPVEVLSTFDGAPTSIRWRNITAFTWHPELN